MTPEATIKAKIREYLTKELGAYYFAPVQMGMGASTVDILACVKGRFVAIEVKVPGKYPTARQLKTLHEVAAAGGHAGWVTSAEELKNQIQYLGLA